MLNYLRHYQPLLINTSQPHLHQMIHPALLRREGDLHVIIREAVEDAISL